MRRDTLPREDPGREQQLVRQQPCVDAVRADALPGWLYERVGPGGAHDGGDAAGDEDRPYSISFTGATVGSLLASGNPGGCLPVRPAGRPRPRRRRPPPHGRRRVQRRPQVQQRLGLIAGRPQPRPRAAARTPGSYSATSIESPGSNGTIDSSTKRFFIELGGPRQVTPPRAVIVHARLYLVECNACDPVAQVVRRSGQAESIVRHRRPTRPNVGEADRTSRRNHRASGRV